MASKNSSGLSKEISESLTFHQEGIPLLVSSQLLRSRILGQIDLARLLKKRGEWVIEIGEVKSSQAGVAMMGWGQEQRLRGSLIFLSGLFGYPARLIKIVG